MDRVKWLLAGAGDIAVRRVGPALAAAAHSEVAAVCDVARDRAERLAAALGAKEVYADYGEALARSGADAVYIATPQRAHVAMCLAALDADKNFLVEKPLGLDGAECLPLLAAARRKPGLVVSCSNYRRLSAQYRATAAMLERGEIGGLTGGWGVYSSPFYNPGGHPVRKALGMSRVKELGFYLIDIVRTFFGMPDGVMARSGITDPAVMNDVEDVATAILCFPGGRLFTIVFNCTSPGTRHEMEFFGAGGRIYWPQWPPHGNGPVVRITRAGAAEIPAETASNCHLPMIEDYVGALLAGRQPVCTLESAVRTEIVTDAIFRSMESGAYEPVVWKDPA